MTCQDCKRPAMRGDTYCWAHTPNISPEEKKLALIKGGIAAKLKRLTHEPMKIESAQDLKKVIGKLIEELWVGSVDSTRPISDILLAARVYLEVLRTTEYDVELDEIRTRLDAAGL